MGLARVLTVAALLAGGASAADFPVPPGKSFRDAPWAPAMVVVPGGTYLMGSAEAETAREGRAPGPAATERPQVEVTIPTLGVGQAHVTRGDYARFVKATNRPPPPACVVVTNGKWGPVAGKTFRDVGFPQSDRHPVACVGWDDAVAYAAWLSRATGHRYRLLHEAEWEYAARGGTTTARWWGDGREELCRHVNGADKRFDRIIPGEAETNRSCDDGFATTSPAGHYPPNPFGLSDMLGNLWQWTADCFTDHPTAAPADDPACTRRSIRGGSWHNYPSALRAANRFWLPADMHSSSLGFRVVRLPDGAPE